MRAFRAAVTSRDRDRRNRGRICAPDSRRTAPPDQPANNLGFHHARPVCRPHLFIGSDGHFRCSDPVVPRWQISYDDFLSDEDGPTAVEYAVMLALIVGACIASVNVLANAAGDSFNDSGDATLRRAWLVAAISDLTPSRRVAATSRDVTRRSAPLLLNQHRVAVAVEAVLLRHGRLVGLADQRRPAKRLHQQQQRRAREVEVREQRVDRAGTRTAGG